MNVAIEVTRNCNMECMHCLRGESQNLVISDEILQKTFLVLYKKTITLTITGGEPSLVPESIERILYWAKNCSVDIESFYIATNGKHQTTEFLVAVIKLYNYCDDKEGCVVDISNDPYHDHAWEEGDNLLTALTFTRFKFKEDADYLLLNEGNTPENYGPRYTQEIDVRPVEIDEDFDIDQVDMIYINCLGNILLECNLSYCTQNFSDLIIGNVMEHTDCLKEFPWEEKIAAYNQRVESNGYKTISDVKAKYLQLA